MTLPFAALPVGRIIPATVGPPVPGAAALGEELRRSLPATLVQALDGLGEQIDAEIFRPLLTASSVEELASAFERVFPKFREYYISTLHILLAGLQENPQRFSTLTIQAFRESENVFRQHGPQWIGPTASQNAIQALNTIVRIAKAATKLLEQAHANGNGPNNEAAAEQWANSIILYALAFSSVLAALTMLTSGVETSARLDNVATLALWSKKYAVQAYHLSKVIGLLRRAPSSAPIDRGDEEDLVLAEAGLESYVEALQRDEQQ